MGSKVSFVLDNELTELDFDQNGLLTPDTTVLNFLRNRPGHKGTKEGCAEGDCGACTVVMASLDEKNKFEYKAYDSCLIFLPMLHGKWLITVENLGSFDNMHPVQQAMVDSDGSQCGYCTPGFVMSLLALYKNTSNPDREEINDALTGNLCRCTGYRPIAEAAAKACALNGKDHFDELELNVKDLLNKINNSTINISGSGQVYHQPVSLDEALQIRQDHPGILIVHGATDVGLMVTKQKKRLPELLDISNIGELKQITSGSGFMEIGAGVSLESLKAACKNRFPALFDMLAVFGSRQIRNMATLGGNLANASPIGDTPPVLIAYNAEVTLASISGIRTMPVSEFITGYRSTLLKEDEIITKIRIPDPEKHVFISSYKISKRKDLDISTVSSCFRLEIDENSIVKEIRLIYGGMAAMTKRASGAEEFLINKEWTRANVEAAMDLTDKDFSPISDARSGAAGRRVMARNLLLKFWSETRLGD